jgi:hypothetical protein
MFMVFMCFLIFFLLSFKFNKLSFKSFSLSYEHLVFLHQFFVDKLCVWEFLLDCLYHTLLIVLTKVWDRRINIWMWHWVYFLSLFLLEFLLVTLFALITSWETITCLTSFTKSDFRSDCKSLCEGFFLTN